MNSSQHTHEWECNAIDPQQHLFPCILCKPCALCKPCLPCLLCNPRKLCSHRRLKLLQAQRLPRVLSLKQQRLQVPAVHLRKGPGETAVLLQSVGAQQCMRLHAAGQRRLHVPAAQLAKPAGYGVVGAVRSQLPINRSEMLLPLLDSIPAK